MNLRFEGLKRLYNGKAVLDIAFGQVSDGKITGVIGPNGAGKSTFLNIVAGLDRPTAGRVLYGCAAAGDAQAFAEELPREKVTLLFQQPYLIHTTVERNLAYPLRLRKVPQDVTKARVAELMDELGLTPLARQKARDLSGGEMQKVAFARALSFHPELLLMDEPTSNIDMAATAEIERIIKKENAEEGMTMVIVGHNLAQIRRLCDEVIFMSQGRIVECGTAAEVLGRPQFPETKAFIEGRLLL